MKFRTIAMLMLLTGFVSVACGSQKTAVRQDSVPQQADGAFTPETYFKKVVDNSCHEKCLTAKVKCEIQMDGNSISTSGTLRMKKDDVIQISLLDPIVGAFELGRMEFTQDKLLIIDRYNKKYINVPYAEVDFLKKCDIDFNSLQNLFWNDIFVPAKSKPEASDFTFTDGNGGEPKNEGTVCLQYVDEHLTYAFSTLQPEGRLTRTMINGNRDKDSMFAFVYADFQNFEGRLFPNDMIMSFVMGNKSASLSFLLSSLKNKSGWETRTKIPTKYKQEDAERIFKSLIGK